MLPTVCCETWLCMHLLCQPSHVANGVLRDVAVHADADAVHVADLRTLCCLVLGSLSCGYTYVGLGHCEDATGHPPASDHITEPHVLAGCQAECDKLPNCQGVRYRSKADGSGGVTSDCYVYSTKGSIGIGGKIISSDGSAYWKCYTKDTTTTRTTAATPPPTLPSNDTNVAPSYYTNVSCHAVLRAARLRISCPYSAFLARTRHVLPVLSISCPYSAFLARTQQFLPVLSIPCPHLFHYNGPFASPFGAYYFIFYFLAPRQDLWPIGNRLVTDWQIFPKCSVLARPPGSSLK